MIDEESQQASIPKDYGTVPASADAGGSARRVVIIALAAIALFASGVAVGSSIATTPRGASAHGYYGEGVDGQDVGCRGLKCHWGGDGSLYGGQLPIETRRPVQFTPPSHPNLAARPPVDSINQWSYLDNGQISESGNIVAQGKKPTQLVAQDSSLCTVCTPGFAAMCQDTKKIGFNSLTTPNRNQALCIFCTPNVAAFCQTTNPN